jgi:hypothetical protein
MVDSPDLRTKLVSRPRSLASVPRCCKTPLSGWPKVRLPQGRAGVLERGGGGRRFAGLSPPASSLVLRRSRAPSRSCQAAAIKEQEGETGPRGTGVLIMYMDYAFHQVPCAGSLLVCSSIREPPAATETASRRPKLAGWPAGA